MEDKSQYIIQDEPAFFTGQKGELVSLLEQMVKFEASGLFIMGGEPVWMSSYSKKHKITLKKLSISECESLLIQAYQSNSATTILNSQQALNFAYQYQDPNTKAVRRFRVNAVSATRNNSPSMTITFRLIQTIPPKTEDLKIPDDIIETCVNNEKGIIYVAGATGQGKSTTLASIMRHILEREDANINMVDIGEPIEYTMDKLDLPSSFVTPLNVGKDIKSFYDGVVNCMRMEPQIIQISESRDTETISASLDASKSGHAVYTTVHSGTVPETLRRIVNMFPYGSRSIIQLDVVESTKMIIAQKLIPTIDGKITAIREYLIFDPEVREALWDTENIAKTAIEVLNRKGYPMTKDLERVYSEGLISEAVFNKYMTQYQNEIKATQKAT